MKQTSHCDVIVREILKKFKGYWTRSHFCISLAQM